MALATGSTEHACPGMATSSKFPREPAAAIAYSLGCMAAHYGCLLQRGNLLPPVLPVNVRPGHLCPLRHRRCRDVAGLPALWLAWLVAPPGAPVDRCRADTHHHEQPVLGSVAYSCDRHCLHCRGCSPVCGPSASVVEV